MGEFQATEFAHMMSEWCLPWFTENISITEDKMNELKEECRRTLAGGNGEYCVFYTTIGRKRG